MPATPTTLRLSRRDDGAAIVTFARPAVQNALDPVMIAETTALLRELARDETMRALVLAGDGLSFAAGTDPAWAKAMPSLSVEEHRADLAAQAGLIEALAAIPCPTLAAVQGAAIGLGLALVATADMVIATENATFAASDVKLGLVPALLAAPLVRALGERTAARWLMLGERFDSTIALRDGLVHQVVANRKLPLAVDVFLNRLKEGAPLAQRRIKAMLSRDAGLLAIDIQLASRLSAEGTEGMTAFLARRRPAWTE